MMAGHEEGSDESPVRNYEQQHFKNIFLPISQFPLHGGIQLFGDNRKADPGRHALHDIWLHTAAGARGGRCLFFLTMRCFNDAMFSNS